MFNLSTLAADLAGKPALRGPEPENRATRIPAALCDLDAAMNNLNGLYSELYKRLQPALRIVQETQCNGGQNNAPCPSTGCQMADDILARAGAIHAMAKHMEQTLAALEL